MASICIGSKVSGFKRMLYCITIDDFLAAISKMPYRQLRTLCWGREGDDSVSLVTTREHMIKRTKN